MALFTTEPKDATGNILVTQSTVPWTVNVFPSYLGVTVTGTAGTAVTCTLPAAASQFQHISLIEITKYATAAITGTTTPVVVTSTNLPGNMAWSFETAQAVGTVVERLYLQHVPFKSSVINTATTIVCPAITSVIWRVNVQYYLYS